VRVSNSSGANILCDPWVNGGAFLGSWFHWPPLPTGFEKELIDAPCDGVYISHLHPDHYDPKFIAKFSRARPDVPIYIAEFGHPWLKRSISAVVGKGTKVVEIPTLQEVEVASGFTLSIFAADTCNPAVCGVNVPCQTDPDLRGIDSIGVFRADGQTVVNANDAMGVQLIPRIAANVGHADLLMGHYGGASPFPQCFPDVEDKKAAAEKVVDVACKMLISAADSLDVKYVMPFAGQYVLGGRLADLNSDRATIPLDHAVVKLRELTSKEVISVMPAGEFDLSSGLKGPDYRELPIEVSMSYIERISKTSFSYEKAAAKPWHNIPFDLINAAQTVVERSHRARIAFENSFVIGDGTHWVTINLDPNRVGTSVEFGSKPKFMNVTTITMPHELLRRLSTRKSDYKGFTPMHWNQADVGSHFIWHRTGEFDLVSHGLLNFYGV
jgi:UDP-MurNAc hydroxylase